MKLKNVMRRVFEAFGGLFLSFRVPGQKRQDLIGCDGIEVLFTELGIKSFQDQSVILGRIFFQRSFSDNP
jgi:hypothetical protein